jgi:hypothetical protein
MMVFHHVQAYEPWSKIGSYNHNQLYIPGWWFGTVFFLYIGNNNPNHQPDPYWGDGHGSIGFLSSIGRNSKGW